jgi:hypothetical protein
MSSQSIDFCLSRKEEGSEGGEEYIVPPSA